MVVIDKNIALDVTGRLNKIEVDDPTEHLRLNDWKEDEPDYRYNDYDEWDAGYSSLIRNRATGVWYVI